MKQDWSNRTILIVEDDEISFKYLDLILSRRSNVNIIWAVNGQLAVDYCKLYDQIDLVLTDIQLPVMDGIEVIKQIRTFRPKLPIIVQTASVYNEECEKCFDAGCDDYVTKPINIDILLFKIDSLFKLVAA